MRATSAFIFECGISTVSCLAICALRIRVRKSAIGSLTAIRLPTRFRDAGNLPLVRQLSQADPAQTELAVVPVCPAASLAPVVLPDLELLRLLLLDQQSFSRHLASPSSSGTACPTSARALGLPHPSPLSLPRRRPNRAWRLSNRRSPPGRSSAPEALARSSPARRSS